MAECPARSLHSCYAHVLVTYSPDRPGPDVILGSVVRGRRDLTIIIPSLSGILFASACTPPAQARASHHSRDYEARSSSNIPLYNYTSCLVPEAGF